MSISKTLIVNINSDKAKAKDKMYIYRNDTGVDMYIELSNLNYSFDGSKNNFRFANALFKTPSGQVCEIDSLEIRNKKIKFSFTEEVVALMQIIGNYELQFQLFDTKGNRLTIPPYYFEVKEPLGNTSLNKDLARVGYAKVDLSYVGHEEETLFAIEDGYIRTDWVSGDIITSQKMNNIEEGISLALERETEVDLVYQSNEPSTVEIGGLPLGYTSSEGISLSDLVYKMLHPYKLPSINFSMSPNTTLYELGATVSTVTLTTTTTKGSDDIKTIAITKNGTVLKSASTDLTVTETNIKTNTTFQAYVSDGTNTIYSGSKSINFVNPIYIGNLTNITSSEIKAMTKKVVTRGSQSHTFNITNKRMCIAVPSEWVLKSIIDPNGFDITSSFSKTTISILCLDGTSRSYTIHYSETTSQNNFTVKFNF